MVTPCLGTVFTKTHYRKTDERVEVRENKEEGVSSYLTLRKREDTGNLKRKR